MKNFSLFGLAFLLTVGDLSAADRKPPITAADLMACVQRMNATATAHGASVVTVVNTKNLRGVFSNDAQDSVESVSEVILKDTTELRAFARKQWSSHSKEALFAVIAFSVDGMEINYDEDGYSVVIGSLTVALPKHITVVQADK